MLHVDLDDQWFELFDPDKIPRGRARAFRSAFYKSMGSLAGDMGSDPSEDAVAESLAKDPAKLVALLEGQEDTEEALVLACVSTWSFGEVTPDVLQTLTDSQFSAIHTACEEGKYADTLNPDFRATPDDESPTTPS